MEGKELRIGNYLHDRKGNLCKVIELREDGIYAPAISEAITGLPNKPIELTEEWLLKFGFEKHGSKWCHSVLSTNIIKGNGFYMNYVNKEIKYVHELQNLFYALTNEELTIKS
ncbi:hypothetical protein CMU85_18180 [Elizabethkingia anophelis]|nr:hypothetical protein [Elizabethkingia anophelis]